MKTPDENLIGGIDLSETGAKKFTWPKIPRPRMKFLWLLLIPLVLIGGHLLNSQTHTFCPLDLACVWTGNQTFTNQTTFTGGWFYGASPVMAAQMTGADCGAKINAADALLSTNPGEIWVNAACGTTISTAVNISAYHSLKFVQGGTWTTSAAITLSNGASIIGIPSGINEDAINNTIPLINPAVVIKQANSTNLVAMVISSGSNVEIHDIALNGNNPTNASTICFTTNTAVQTNHDHLQDSTFEQCGGDDAQILSTGTANQSQGFRVDHSSFNRSLGGSGLAIKNSTDVHVNRSAFELSSGSGLDNLNSTTWVVDSDFANNAGAQLYYHVNGDTALAAFLQGGLYLSGNGFTASGVTLGENLGSNLVINGYNGTNCNKAGQAYIIGNSFNTQTTVTGNTIDGVRIYDSGSNTIIGNKFISGAGSNTFKYGLSIGNVNGGCTSEPSDVVVANGFFNTFGTGTLQQASSTDATLSTVGVFPGSQRARFLGALGGSCPTAGSIGAVCTSAALAWNSPMVDTSYTFTCTLVGTMSGQPHIVKATRTSGTSITLTIAADTAVAADIAGGGEADCLAFHD